MCRPLPVPVLCASNSMAQASRAGSAGRISGVRDRRPPIAGRRRPVRDSGPGCPRANPRSRSYHSALTAPIAAEWQHQVWHSSSGIVAPACVGARPDQVAEPRRHQLGGRMATPVDPGGGSDSSAAPPVAPPPPTHLPVRKRLRRRPPRTRRRARWRRAASVRRGAAGRLERRCRRPTI